MVVKLPPSTIKGFHTHLRKHYAGQGVAFSIWKYIKSLSPAFKPEKMERKYAYSKIFKGEPYSETKLFNHLSDLNKLFSNFLLQQYLKDHPFAKDLLMMQACKAYGLDESFFALHKKMEVELEAQQKKDLWNPLTMMYLSHEHYYYPETERVGAKEVRIQQTIDYLDDFYCLAKLKYICELYNRHNILGEKIGYDNRLEEERFMRKSDNTITYQCYQYAFMLLKDRRDEDFELLKKTLFGNQNSLVQIDRQILISYLISHEAYRARKGRGKGKAILDMYKAGIENRFFMTGGCFEDTHFINIVDVARTIGEDAWAEEFVLEWKDKIEAKKIEAVIAISMALIEFSRRQYQTVIDRLGQLKFMHVHYEMRRRGLLIAAHFELPQRADEHILSLCSAYDQFIRRHMLLQSKKEGVFLYNRIVRKLLEPQPDKNKLRKELECSNQLLYKNWLAQKIAEK